MSLPTFDLEHCTHLPDRWCVDCIALLLKERTHAIVKLDSHMCDEIHGYWFDCPSCGEDQVIYAEVNLGEYRADGNDPDIGEIRSNYCQHCGVRLLWPDRQYMTPLPEKGN